MLIILQTQVGSRLIRGLLLSHVAYLGSPTLQSCNFNIGNIYLLATGLYWLVCPLSGHPSKTVSKKFNVGFQNTFVIIVIHVGHNYRQLLIMPLA